MPPPRREQVARRRSTFCDAHDRNRLLVACQAQRQTQSGAGYSGMFVGAMKFAIATLPFMEIRFRTFPSNQATAPDP